MTNTFNLDIYQQEFLKLSLVYNLKPIELHLFAKIPSTNQKIWSLINSKVQIPTAAIALEQTAGRGQWGRIWQSHSGGLYLSVAISPNISLENSFDLTMATAWGIATILKTYNIPVYLKWPNDLILNHRKLGGIKIETKTTNQFIKNAVIGVGINWKNTVPEVGINLQSFIENQQQATIKSLEHLAAVTITGILSGYEHYCLNGREKLLSAYQNLLHNLHQKIMIKDSPGVITGVTAKGQLKVRLHSLGASSEVFFAPGEITLGYQKFCSDNMP